MALLINPKFATGGWKEILEEQAIRRMGINPKTAPKTWMKNLLGLEEETTSVVTKPTSVYHKMKSYMPGTTKFPDEMTEKDFSKLIEQHYNNLRLGRRYNSRIISPDKTQKYKEIISKTTKDIKIDENDGWFYRKPNRITDNILEFKILPKERLSISSTLDPELINVLDSFISKGEVIVDGKLIKRMTPPNAYYKASAGEKYTVLRSDPITMYFRDNMTEEQLDAIKLITKPFSCKDKISECDELFHLGMLEDANWLSRAKENTPDDLYKSFLKAEKLNPKLAWSISSKAAARPRIKGINHNVYDLYDKSVPPYIKSMANYRYRISAGEQFAIDKVINDYKKAIGKSEFDIIA